MPLVQTPGAANGDPVAVGGLQRELGGADRALLERGVHDVGGSRPASFSSSPPRTASSPFSLRSTSTHPVNRFFAFHSLSPWRRRISLYGASAMRPSVMEAFVPSRPCPEGGKSPRHLLIEWPPRSRSASCHQYMSRLHPWGTTDATRRHATRRPRDRLGAPPRVLVAVDQHPGDRWVLLSPLSWLCTSRSTAATPLRTRVCSCVSARPRRCRLLARRGRDDRPARGAGPRSSSHRPPRPPPSRCSASCTTR